MSRWGRSKARRLTAYAAAGKARWHASQTCARLRTGSPRELRVPLDAATIARMCTECTSWGRWARPVTALGLFLEEFRGVGMAYQLGSCLGPDPDDPDPTARQITQAAATLRWGDPSSNEDGDHDEAARFRGGSHVGPGREQPTGGGGQGGPLSLAFLVGGEAPRTEGPVRRPLISEEALILLGAHRNRTDRPRRSLGGPAERRRHRPASPIVTGRPVVAGARDLKNSTTVICRSIHLHTL